MLYKKPTVAPRLAPAPAPPAPLAKRSARRFARARLGLEAYFAEADTYIAFVKSGATAPGVEAILMPGDSERAMAEKRKVERIFVENETWAQIVASG